MKQKLFFVAAAFFLALLLAFRNAGIQGIVQKSAANLPGKDKKIIRCSPDWNEVKDWLEEADIPPIPGAGKHAWKISTNDDSAQFYFNQGINMYYSFPSLNHWPLSVRPPGLTRHRRCLTGGLRLPTGPI